MAKRRAIGMAAMAACVITMSETTRARAEEGPRVTYSSAVGGPVAGLEQCPGRESSAWPLIGVDPRRENHVLALYQAGGTVASVLARSSDGGRTWARSVVSAATACTGGPTERQSSVNPLFTVGPGGVGHYGQSWIGRRDGMWAFGVLPHQLGPRDQQASAPERADHGQNAALAAHSRDPERLAMLWTEFNEVPNPITYTTVASSRTLFARSSDAGRTWSSPRVVDVPSPDSANVNTRLVRTSDGTLVGVFDRLAYGDASGALVLGSPLELTVHAVVSDDEGATWSKPVLLGRMVWHAVPDPDHGPNEAATPAGSAKFDVAAGPAGEVVAVWHDGSRTVRGAAGRPSAAGTWAWGPLPPTLEAAGEYIQPAVGIDGSGRIGVFHYDFAADRPGDGAWSIRPRFAASDDGGTTWRTVSLAPPFDLHRTNRCNPVTGACELTADYMAIGVYQDVHGLRRGFGVGHTVGPPLAAAGLTEARYARVSLP